jgi:hypothetical protein
MAPTTVDSQINLVTGKEAKQADSSHPLQELKLTQHIAQPTTFN